MKLLRNKKGSLQDLIFIGISLFIFAVVILLMYKIYDSVNTELQANAELTTYDVGGMGKYAANQLEGYFPTVIDNSFIFLTIGLAIVTFVLAAMVRVHPIFFIFFLLGWIFLIFFCGIFSNVYQSIAGDPNFITLANNLTFVSLIMNYLPIIVGVFGTILAIIMFNGYAAGQQQ